MFQCLGADVVFDRLGLSVEEEAADDKIGAIAALILFQLIEGKKKT